MAAASTSNDAQSRGYTATKDELRTRLRRVEGQIRGVEKMVDVPAADMAAHGGSESTGGFTGATGVSDVL